MFPYGLTYREPLFMLLWPLLGFNWTMWYLPMFVYMRVVFCVAHKLGLERLHILVASQFWILLPAYVDWYIGWDGEPPAVCPDQCYCIWQALPWAQSVSYYLSGWWVATGDEIHNSFVGHAMIFIPCYWTGFYFGGYIFKFLTKLADEPSKQKRFAVSALFLMAYLLSYVEGKFIVDGFNDQCSAFWSSNGAFKFVQVFKNLTFYALNLTMSLVYVIVIAAIVPVHLQYMAKISFSALILSAFVPCVNDYSVMALEIRKVIPVSFAPLVEMLWIFSIPFLFELAGGTLVACAVRRVAMFCIAVRK